MKPVPQTIQLGAFTYAIKRCDGGEPSRIDCDKQEIWLSESLHPQQAAYCLFREALAVAMRDSAEGTVHTDDIALKVIEVWAQNPEVVAWIMVGLVDNPTDEKQKAFDEARILSQGMQNMPGSSEYFAPKIQSALERAGVTQDEAKSIWWKEPVYASVDGITMAPETPNRVCVDWKACKITDDDRSTLRKLKLSAQEACDEGLASIVDDRFQFHSDRPEQALTEAKQETF